MRGQNYSQEITYLLGRVVRRLRSVGRILRGGYCSSARPRDKLPPTRDLGSWGTAGGGRAHLAVALGRRVAGRIAGLRGRRPVSGVAARRRVATRRARHRALQALAAPGRPAHHACGQCRGGRGAGAAGGWRGGDWGGRGARRKGAERVTPEEGGGLPSVPHRHPAAVDDGESRRTGVIHFLRGLSVFVLMHTVSPFGICQGMSCQHLTQPYGWISVIYISLSLFSSSNQYHNVLPRKVMCVKLACKHPHMNICNGAQAYAMCSAPYLGQMYSRPVIHMLQE